MKNEFRSDLRPAITHHIATDFKSYPDDLKTKIQWEKLGYKLAENAEPFELWTNKHCQVMCSYYLREDVEKITA